MEAISVNILCKVPLTAPDIYDYLAAEQQFLQSLLNSLKEKNNNSQSSVNESLLSLMEEAPPLVKQLAPTEPPENQIKALLELANHLIRTFTSVKFKEMELEDWFLLAEGFLGKKVEEDYEIAILFYLVAIIYQWLAKDLAPTSRNYRYYTLNSLAALKSSKAFIDALSFNEGDYAALFKELLEVRLLEVEAEIVRSEAFQARQKGDFERASKLYAGVAANRFSMMNYDLPEDSDNRVKIFASTELGMACFYIAVGLTNLNKSEKAYLYLLKSKSYFENSVKLAKTEEELLKAAEKRLSLVNSSIGKIKSKIKGVNKDDLAKIADPQPLVDYPKPAPLVIPKDRPSQIFLICPDCLTKTPWKAKCSKCGEQLPIE